MHSARCFGAALLVRGCFVQSCPHRPLPPLASRHICCSNGGNCQSPLTGVLAVHNAKRLLHQNTASLVWSSTLAASAQVKHFLGVWQPNTKGM